MYSRAALLLLLTTVLFSCHEKSAEAPHASSQSTDQLLKTARDSRLPSDTRIKAALTADTTALQQHDHYIHIICSRLLGTIYVKQNKDSIAESYLLTVLRSDPSLSPEDHAIAANNMGVLLAGRSDYTGAISYYLNARDMFRELKKTLSLANNLLDLSVAYKNTGQVTEAFSSCIEALHIVDTLENSKEKGYCYISAANILKELDGKDGEAMDYLKMAVDILRKNGDSLGVSMALNSEGSILRNRENYEAALSCYAQALTIKEKYASPKSVATTIDNIAELKVKMGDPLTADTYFRKALAIRKGVHDIDGILTTSNRLARSYILQNHLDQALKLATEAYDLGHDRPMLKSRLENALILSDIYRQMKQYEHSSYHQALALSLKDSIFRSDMASAMAEMRTRYRMEQKEKELLVARQQVVLETEKSRNRLQLWSISAIAVLLVSISGAYIYRKREKYIVAQKLVEVRQEALRAQLDTHFISDTIDSINEFVEENNKDAASEYLLGFSRLIRTVLENSFRKIVSVHEELTIISEYFALARLRFPQGHITFNIVVAKDIDPSVTMIPPMVLHVLTENAIQHAFSYKKKGVLSITISKKGKYLHCMVEDNGMGRKMSAMNKTRRRISYGNTLAERLIRTLDSAEGKVNYQITDLVDEHGNASGTSAEILFPLLSNS